MLKRFWASLNDWAEVLGIDDPHGDYIVRLEERVAKLERNVEVLRTSPVGSQNDGVHQLVFNSERR